MADARRTTIHIFLSSPGEVAEERARAVLVVNALRKEFRRFFDLETVAWDYEALLSRGHFQDVITPPPGDCDVVVGILWSRLGSPLPVETAMRRYEGLDGHVPVCGTEWEIESALAASQARGQPDLIIFRKRVAPPIPIDPPAERARRNAELDALDAFWQRHFTDGSDVRVLPNDFTGLDEFEAKLTAGLRKLLRARADRIDADAARATWLAGSPYRGLEVFEPRHHPVFFGRAQAQADILQRLLAGAERGCAFLLVAGQSGVGKSSLVQAGVIPVLAEPGAVPDNGPWCTGILRPGIDRPRGPDAKGQTPAEDLFDRLAAAIAAALPAPAGAPALQADTLAAEFRRGEGALLVAQALALLPPAPPPLGRAAPGPQRLLLLVDQMEELFGPEGADAAAREVFGQVLARLAASGGRIWVVATLRSDHWHRLADVPSLHALTAGEATYLLAPPRGDEIAQMIRAPAEAAGIGFEADPDTQSGLDDILLAEAADDPNALPLLEFALDTLYVRDIAEAGGRRLTLAGYRALGGGTVESGGAAGLAGVVAGEAERVCHTLGAVDAQGRESAALRHVLLALAYPARGDGAAKARVAAWAELCPGAEHERIVTALIAARLLISRGRVGDDDASPPDGAPGADTHDPGAAPVGVRVAHEALLQHWPRYARLLEAEAAYLTLRDQVAEAERAWRAHGRADGYLLRGGPLAAAQDLLLSRPDALPAAARSFVTASTQRQNRAVRRLAAAVVAFALLALGAAGAGVWAYTQQREAEAARAEAVEAQQEAETQAGIAEAQRQAATVAAQEAEEAREEAERQRAAAEESAAEATRQAELAEARRVYAQSQEDLAQQRADEAEAAQAEAEHSFDIALQAANALVFDIAQGLRSQAGMSTGMVRTILGSAEATFDALLAASPDDPRLLRAQAVMLDEFAQTYLSAGDTATAEHAARRSEVILRRLSELNPANTGWQRDVSLILGRLGDALRAQGDAAAALAAYRDGLEISRRLAALDPDNGEWQRAVSLTLDRLGDMLRAQGDAAGTLAAYREGLGIRRRLAELDPANTEWQSAVALSLERLGDVLWVRGDAAGTLAAYREGLEIRRRLVALDPDNSFWQHNLSVSLNRLGDVLRAQGDAAGALATYREWLEISRRLAALDPANTEWQSDVTVGLERVGDVLRALGDAPGAVTAYREGLEMSRQLAAIDPNNTRWQRAVAVSLSKVGDMYLARGDAAEALKAYREWLEINRRLATLNPVNTEWQSDISVSLNRVGDVLLSQGDVDGALAAYREGLEITRRLVELDSDNTGWQRDVGAGLDRLGDVLQAQGDAAGALAAFREGLEIIHRLAELDPANAGWQRDVAVSVNKVGDVLLSQGDADGALAAYREGLEISRRLAALDPSNTEWQRGVVASLGGMGDVLLSQGDASVALEAYREGLEISRQLAALDPDNTVWQRDVSFGLNKVGDVLRTQGDAPGAMATYNEGLEISRRLAARDPDNTGWQRDISVSLGSMGDVLLAHGDALWALVAYRESLEIRRRLAALDPANVGWQMDLAQSLIRSALAESAPAAKLTEALAILQALAADDRLPASQQGVIPLLETILGALESAPARQAP
ncbi:MAG: tetratricopeptide repeat protein [Rhodospirillaceae bacterium]|nr:tetratricopeptide repeat protein [Rhodospirillaceae bacterium]